MEPESTNARRKEIEAAAYAVLEAKGYKAASMLVIAKQAAASNETMYRWYGNKQGLFRALVEENAKQVREALEARTVAAHSALDTLRDIGPALLTLVTSEKAIALNRAAAADVSETHTLGPTIAASGKGTIGPLLKRLMDRARRGGELAYEDEDDPLGVYLSLLIGDLQSQRMIGVMRPLSNRACHARAHRAHAMFVRLFAN